MKKVLFCSAVIILAAVSCNKIENDMPVQESSVPSFMASVDGADTKTVIDGTKSYWNGTESLRVLDGSVSKVYTATAEKSDKATFEEADAQVALSGDDYLAVYPEAPSGSVTWDGDIANSAKKFWLTGNQTATADTYDPSAHIAVAYTEAGNHSLQFKNVNALIKVTVANDDVTEVCFYGNAGEVISGNFDVLYNNGEPTISIPDTDESYTKNAYAKITGEIANGSTYYISILPTNFSRGFSIEFVIDGVKYTKTLTSEYNVARNQIVDIPVVEFETQVVETKTIYMLPSSYLNELEGRYAAYCWGEEAAETWYDMTDSDSDGIYELEVPMTFQNVIFCSMKSSTTENVWDNKQYQSADLVIPSDEKFCYIIHSAEWATLEDALAYEEPAETTKKIYFNPGGSSLWDQADAWFEAWIWGAGDQWVTFEPTSESGIYVTEVPIGTTGMKILRRGPSHASGSWDAKWNNTGDITLGDNNLITITGWGGSDFKLSVK